MTKEKIFALIRTHLLEILPSLDESSIDPVKSMKDYGANSIDRVDVIIQTMEALNLRFPLHELKSVENIQGLIDFFHAQYSNAS